MQAYDTADCGKTLTDQQSEYIAGKSHNGNQPEYEGNPYKQSANINEKSGISFAQSVKNTSKRRSNI